MKLQACLEQPVWTFTAWFNKIAIYEYTNYWKSHYFH